MLHFTLFSNQFLSLGFFCYEEGRLETGIILQFPVFDSLRYHPFVQCSAEILADGVCMLFFLGWLVGKFLRTLPVLLTLSTGFLQAPQERLFGYKIFPDEDRRRVNFRSHKMCI